MTDRNDIHESDSLFEVVLTEIDADVSTVIHVESITGKTKHRSLRKFNSSGE